MGFNRIHCCLSSESATPNVTEKPPDQSAAEGNNITLEWRYNFRGGSFYQLSFGNPRKSRIVDKSYSDKAPFIASAYRGRLLANVTDTYTSITLLRVNRTDSTTYTLTVVSNTRESFDSKVEITVECKYRRRTKGLDAKYILLVMPQFFSASCLGERCSSVVKQDLYGLHVELFEPIKKVKRRQNKVVLGRERSSLPFYPGLPCLACRPNSNRKKSTLAFLL